MAKAYVFLADGFEDIEALTPVDVLRRGGVEVVTVAINEDMSLVTSAHGVPVMADALASDCSFGDADLIVLPGGMPGAKNLFENATVRQTVHDQLERGGRVGAICAAPAVVLGQMGLLNGKKATCYPGFEQLLTGADYTGELCTVDGLITTAEGPAAAFPFAYELLRQLKDEQTAHGVAEGMRFLHLMEK